MTKEKKVLAGFCAWILGIGVIVVFSFIPDLPGVASVIGLVPLSAGVIAFISGVYG